MASHVSTKWLERSHPTERLICAQMGPIEALFAPFRADAEAGALIAFGFNVDEQWRLSATYIDQILKGAKPADLPVHQPVKFEVVVNLKTAKALGLTIPEQFLLSADEVIE